MRLLFERSVPNSEAFSFPQHALHLHRAGMCADTRQKSEEKKNCVVSQKGDEFRAFASAVCQILRIYN